MANITVQQVQLRLRSATARMNTSSSAQAKISERFEAKNTKTVIQRLKLCTEAGMFSPTHRGESFPLCPGVNGGERRRSSSVTKFGVSLSLSSAWRPTGFKPLRAVISTDRGRVQGAGCKGEVVVVRDSMVEEVLRYFYCSKNTLV